MTHEYHDNGFMNMQGRTSVFSICLVLLHHFSHLSLLFSPEVVRRTLQKPYNTDKT